MFEGAQVRFSRTVEAAMTATLRRLTVGVLSCALVTAVYGQEPADWRITRDLKIDAAENDLSPISFIAVAPNGTIAVSQQQDRQVRFFNASGKFLGSFGRGGQGPGEFMRLGRMVWLADTLAINDGSNRRYTLISPSRDFVRTVSTQVSMSMRSSPTVNETRFTGLPLNLVADGSFVFFMQLYEGLPQPPLPGGAKGKSVLLWVDSTGVFRNVIAWRPAIDCTVAFEGSRGVRGVVAIPFCPMLLQEVASDGRRIGLSWVEQGNEPSYRVAVFRVNGDTVFNRRYLYRPVRISQAARESAVAALSKNPQVAQALRKGQQPQTYPPVAGFLLGVDETTWVELMKLKGDRIWNVLDRRGNPMAEVKVPRNVQVMVASREAIWGIETDEGGLQHIVRYEVSR